MGKSDTKRNLAWDDNFKNHEFYFRWSEISVVNIGTNLFDFQPSKLETLF